MTYFKWSVPVLTILIVSTILFFFERKTMNSTEILPGIRDLNPAILSEFKKMKEKRGPSYIPRTHHLTPEGKPLFTNRLFLEKSPYLLQHAHNPVNWYPWSEEAFKTAQKKNQPILLSIGYSTCHWCHVMEEESFEDLEIARYINEHYIPVKVDREERPDIDSVYMSAVQITTGRGGWPMTVWLTPQKQVFYAGTYFPPRKGDRGSSIGFLSLLKELKDVYQEKQEDIKRAGQEIQKALQASLSPTPVRSHSIAGKDTFHTLLSQVKKGWDPIHGGIKGAPKFPSSFPTRLLLRSYLKIQDKYILQTIHTSLNGMQTGGMHDQVGGGFHRYSTDEEWLVPHFEKMLYDQALLALTYLEAYQFFNHLSPSGQTTSGISNEKSMALFTQKMAKSYKETAIGILDYIIRDMQSKEGGFYSATDADSLVYNPFREARHSGLDPESRHSREGGNPQKDHSSQGARHSREGGNPEKPHKEEGFYFTWTPEEIDQALNKQQAELIKKHYGVTAQGNFEGRNILHVSEDLSTIAKELSLEPTQAKTILTEARKILYQTRETRPLPLRDEKILSGWNGLMISAFVYGYFVLNEKKYLLQAEKSARFILDNMYKKGQLYRSWKEGTAYIPAYLDDYSFFISALIDLFEWTGNIKWLKEAIKLDQTLEKDFEDKEHGGFFMTGKSYEPLLVREKPLYDGAEPSGNSIAAMNLLRLKEITGNDAYKDRAEKVFRAFGTKLQETPFAFSESLLALDHYRSRAHEIVLVLPDETDLDEDPLFNELKKWYLPNKVLTVVHHSQVEKQQEILKPISQKKALDGKTTVYICEEGACQFPTSELKELKRQLKEIQTLDYN